MNEELKPCPFCGGEAEIIIFSVEYGTVTVGCTNEECDITMGKAFFTDKEAIQHWNRRVNKALSEILETIIDEQPTVFSMGAKPIDNFVNPFEVKAGGNA